MAKNILVNSIHISSTVSQAKIAAGLIDTNKELWSSQGESSVALTAFADQFAALQDVISLYQELLQRDLDAASKVCSELIASDLNLSAIWK